MPGMGLGVREIRIALRDGPFRIIYLASRFDAVYALHGFRKVSQKTAYRDLTYAKNQFRQLKETRL